MVNIFSVYKFILHGIMKLVGVRPQTVEIEPGTIMNFWVSSNIPNKIENTPKKSKPAVVFLHGFAMDGIFTWQLQVLSLAKNYAVYVPDFLFFGGSITDKLDRSPEFQAECVAKGLRKMGVERCTLVGLSYGGMVGFKMAELHPNLVESIVATGSVLALTRSISDASLERLGFKCWPDYLLPDSVKGVRNMFEIAAYKFPYLPDWIYKDCLEVMFGNRKEKEELLGALVVDDKDFTIADFPQAIRRQRKTAMYRGGRPPCSNGKTFRLQQAAQGNSCFFFRRCAPRLKRPFLFFCFLLRTNESFRVLVGNI
ncbi:hypothetical protein PRUPE_8G096000 [Prunus persica]|uniref:AB hydrolase-1 domain-containing protein n=1 Tax=Prunus persica TaxID=3760 RepID=A0A251MVN0_PRUPE|nr:hypothetical protein PRUPE_8G096000 [Prunus persica]